MSDGAGAESGFPSDYATSRARFVAGVAARGGASERHVIAARGPSGAPLSIDVGVWPGPDGDATPALALSSGLHGVEGPFGAAVQCALLEDTARFDALRARRRLVMIHALNPFGYAYGRRWNEDGVDLNRNFLIPGARYEGAHPLYARLDPLLNPDSPPRRPDVFPLLAPLVIARFGLRALKEATPSGQYAFPSGLFYGGSGPSETVRILSAHLPRWIGGASETLHLDFHTGLGPWASHKLITETDAEADRVAALRARFGADVVELATTSGVSYPSRGALKTWADHVFADRRYEVLTVEFGAYSGARTLQALRAENRAWRFDRGGARHAAARARLWETFVPRDRGWRDRVLRDALGVCAAAA